MKLGGPRAKSESRSACKCVSKALKDMNEKWVNVLFTAATTITQKKYFACTKMSIGGKLACRMRMLCLKWCPPREVDLDKRNLTCIQTNSLMQIYGIIRNIEISLGVFSAHFIWHAFWCIAWHVSLQSDTRFDTHYDVHSAVYPSM